MFIRDTNIQYDDDRQLYSCYVGKNNEDMSLWFTCWGQNAEIAALRANFICKLLNDITYKKAKNNSI